MRNPLHMRSSWKDRGCNLSTSGESGTQKSYTIGRGKRPDVCVPAGYETVSRLHARFTELPEGKFRLEDLGSSAGTFVFLGGRWERIKSADIEGDLPIRLANCETSINALLLQRNRPGGSSGANSSETGGAGSKQQEMPPDIFVSYTHADLERVESLVGLFEHQGWLVYWDKNLNPGESWNEKIEANLKGAKAVVVLWSQNSVKSQWVKAEALTALTRKTLVPARLDDVVIPLPFGVVQAADLSGKAGGGDKAANLKGLLATIGRMVKRPARDSRSTILRRLIRPDPIFRGFRPAAVYLDTNGRMSRSHYWLALAMLAPLQIAASAITGLVAAMRFPSGKQGDILLTSWMFNEIVFAFPLLALFSKRLHDFGLSGYLAGALLALTWLQVGLSYTYLEGLRAGDGMVGGTYLAGLSFLILPIVIVGAWPGSAGPNRYGPPPA